MLVTLAILVIMAIGGPMVAVRYSRMAARERDARQLAEANGRELRQVLSNSLVREAANQTGKTDWLELRRDLLEDAVGYYDRLLDHGQVDAQIRFDAANAKANLASMQWRSGRLAAGLKSRQDAASLLRELASEFPDHELYRFELAYNYRVLASCWKHESHRDLTSATHCAQQAFEISSQLFTASPDSTEYALEMNGARVELGLCYAARSRPDDAQAVFLQAVESSEDVAQRFPENDGLHCMVGWTRMHLGETYFRQGKFQQGEMVYAAGEKAFANHVGGAKYYREQYRLAYINCTTGRARCLFHLRQLDEAETALRQALERLESVDVEATGLDWIASTRQSLEELLVDVLITQRKFDEAEERLRQSIGTDNVRSGELSSMDASRVIAKFNLVRLLWFAGQHDESRELCQQVAQTLTDFPTRFRHFRLRFLVQCPFPEWQDGRRAVGLIEEQFAGEQKPWRLLSLAYEQIGDWSAARADLMKAINEHHGGDESDRLRMAIIERRLGDETASMLWYDKAQAAREAPIQSTFTLFPQEWDSLRSEFER